MTHDNPAYAVREALLPCPFCGREPKYSSRADHHTDTKEAHFIACYCGGYAANAHQFSDSRDGVIAKWNNRPSLAALAGAAPVAEVVDLGWGSPVTIFRAPMHYPAPGYQPWPHAPAKAREVTDADVRRACAEYESEHWLDSYDAMRAALATFAEGME